MNSDDLILFADKIYKGFVSPNGGRVEVLRGVSLKLLRGESVSIVGESGAGKTTFLNIHLYKNNQFLILNNLFSFLQQFYPSIQDKVLAQ